MEFHFLKGYHLSKSAIFQLLYTRIDNGFLELNVGIHGDIIFVKEMRLGAAQRFGLRSEKLLAKVHSLQKPSRSKGCLEYLRQFWPFYLMLLPAVLDVLIFRYFPMYGVQIAFRDYKVRAGIWGSQWVGLKHFIRFVESPNFWQIMSNTFRISFYQLICGFPLPILLAFMIDELRSPRMKKVVQMLTYAPHFISVVALVGLINLFLNRESGILNLFRQLLGLEAVNYLAMPEAFLPSYIISGIWQETGWGTIIYLAALSSLDASITEAAIIDGTTRMQRIWYINLPTILPTIVIMLIMSTGSMLNVGFEKVFLMQNSLTQEVSEVISTYTYKLGILQGQFSYTTAIGLFNSVINAVLLVMVNAVCRRLGDTSLW